VDYQAGEGDLEWRDTYFILFSSESRPSLTQIEHAIATATRGVKLANLEADDEGMFESLMVDAPEDNAALEISYETGEAVREQGLYLVENLGRELNQRQRTQLLGRMHDST
jgi:hypothetical protein